VDRLAYVPPGDYFLKKDHLTMVPGEPRCINIFRIIRHLIKISK